MKTFRFIGMTWFAILMSINFIACSDDEEVSKIEIQEGNNIEIRIGEKKVLHALHYPEYLTAPDFTWSSSNTDIISIESMTGEITAKAVGEATIIVRAFETLSATCKIRVLPIEAESIRLNHKEYTLEVEDTFDLVATILPANTTDKTIIWQSSDESLVKLNEKNKNIISVVALAVGNCKITASDKSGKCIAECNVTINEISVKGIESEKDVNIMIGDEHQILYSIIPENAANKNVIWSIEDTSIANITETGIVTGLKKGVTNVTIKTEDGNYSTISTITVTDIIGMLQGFVGGGVIIDGYRQPGTTNCTLKNNSKKEIKLKSLQLIDSYTMIGGNVMEIPNTPILKPGEKVTYTVTLNRAIYKPIFRWTIIFEETEYIYSILG